MTTYFDRFIFSKIAEYLGDLDYFCNLRFVSKNAFGHPAKYAQVAQLLQASICDRALEACKYDLVDAAIEYLPHSTSYTIGMLFMTACKYNSIRVVRWFIGKHVIVDDKNQQFLGRAFCNAVEQDALDVAKYLHEIGCPREISQKEINHNLCRNNGSVIRWMFDGGLIPIEQYQHVFTSACGHGHIDFAKYVYSRCELSEIDPTCALKLSCKRGAFIAIKWLLDEFKPMFKTKYKRYIFTHGHFEVAKWLYDNDPNVIAEVNSMQYKSPILEATCGRLSLEFIDWLLEHHTFSQENLTHALIQFIRYDTRDANDIGDEAVKRLLTAGADIMHQQWWTFDYAITHLYPSTIKMLYRHCVDRNIQITMKLFGRFFKNACEMGKYENSKMIFDLCPDRETLISSPRTIDAACFGGNIQLVKWLLSMGAPLDRETAKKSALSACQYDVCAFIEELP